MDLVVRYAVEGIIDEAVMARLIVECGARPGHCYGKNGKAKLLSQLNGFNNAAREWPWVVLLDLDRDADCAPEAIGSWLTSPSQHLLLRVAVREIEAWMLADAERFARYFGVRTARIPLRPDKLDNPKRDLVNLVRTSRYTSVRQDVVPKQKSGRDVGPGYTQRLIEYATSVENGWRPETAAKNSDSLARCRRALAHMVHQMNPLMKP